MKEGVNEVGQDGCFAPGRVKESKLMHPRHGLGWGVKGKREM